VWAWRAWIEDARRIPPLTQPGGGAAEGVGCTSACLAWLFVPSPAWVATMQHAREKKWTVEKDC
jgi:hypothetical protein